MWRKARDNFRSKVEELSCIRILAKDGFVSLMDVKDGLDSSAAFKGAKSCF